MRLEVETGLTIIVFPKLAEAAGNARGVPNGGVRLFPGNVYFSPMHELQWGSPIV